MNAIVRISVAVLVIFFIACPPSSSQSFILFLPDSISAIENPNDLEPFLTSKKEGYRVWGTYRLGQIGSEPDIDRLLQLYESEPYRVYDGTTNGLSDGVKYYSIIGMAEIGGLKAQAEISNIADNYGVTKDQDSLITLSAICETLGRFSDEKSYDKLKAYYENTDMDKDVRISALAGIYLHNLKKPENASPSDSVEYLLNEISNHFSRNLLELENYIITDAVNYIFYFKINNPSIANELGNRVADINNDEDLKKFLQNTLELMNQRLIDGGAK